MTTMAGPRVTRIGQAGGPAGLAQRVGPFRLLSQLSEDRRWALLLLGPSVVIIGAIVLCPMLYGIGLSFREMRLTRPDLGTDLVGLRHYRALLADEVFGIALRNTALWVVIAVGLELALGLASALALNRRRRWLGAMAVLILIPWFLPNVIAANIWALMLDPRLGVINDILMRLGLLSQYKAWFADPRTALATAAVVEAWHGFPFFTLLLLAALKGIPDELYDAAAVDGATAMQRLWHITLPMLKMVIVATVVLRVIGLVNSPDLLLILTGGGPGHATQVLSLYAFEIAYRSFDFGYASALSVVMFVALMVFCYLYIRVSGVMDKS
jgi:multiple sugar transport system permease protein